MGCASRGTRETEDMEQVRIIDPDVVAQATATGKRVVRDALLTAVAVTVLFVIAV